MCSFAVKNVERTVLHVPFHDLGVPGANCCGLARNRAWQAFALASICSRFSLAKRLRLYLSTATAAPSAVTRMLVQAMSMAISRA